MAWQRFRNKAGVPVNIRLSNAGITYYYENNVKVYSEFFTGGVGWDLTVYYSSDSTKIDPSKDNVAPIAAIATIVGGAVIAAAGVGLTVVTFGAATPIVIAGCQIATAGAAAAAAATIAGAGAAGVVGSVALTIANAVIYPATVTGLYGANDHNFDIYGGFEGTVDEKTKNLTITKINPLAISYINCQSGERTTPAGYPPAT
jgi:hypothetical protein